MSHITVDAEKVHFTKTSATHACCELSDLTREHLRPDVITITKRGRSWDFHHVGTKRNWPEGHAEFFSYKCTSPNGKVFALTVFND